MQSPRLGLTSSVTHPALWKFHFHCNSRTASLDIGLCGEEASKTLGYLPTSTCTSMGRNTMQLFLMNQPLQEPREMKSDLVMTHKIILIITFLSSLSSFCLSRQTKVSPGQEHRGAGESRCDLSWPHFSWIKGEQEQSQIQVTLRKIRDKIYGVTIWILQRRCPVNSSLGAFLLKSKLPQSSSQAKDKTSVLANYITCVVIKSWEVWNVWRPNPHRCLFIGMNNKCQIM